MDEGRTAHVIRPEENPQSQSAGTNARATAYRFEQEWVVAAVESIFEQVVDGILENDKKLTVTIRSRGRVAGQAFDHETRVIRPTTISRTREISFPGSTPKDAWNFAVLVRILQLVHEALVSGTTTTKRDIYYKDPGLFLKQDVVDRFIDDIACTLGVDRGCLNVVAAAKGLVAGALKITRKDGSILYCALENGGILVPDVRDVDFADLSEVKWILLVEKEAKGYPDISTRAFLRLLSGSRPKSPLQPPPIFALLDFDPDGLSILSTYKYGSAALAHENSQLAVPSISWLGIRSADLQDESADEAHGILRLSARDRGKAVKMLGSEVFAVETVWRRELQVMLFLNAKAEIQVVSGFGREGLERWVEGRVLGST